MLVGAETPRLQELAAALTTFWLSHFVSLRGEATVNALENKQVLANPKA